MCIRRRNTIFFCYYSQLFCKSRYRIFCISETLKHNTRVLGCLGFPKSRNIILDRENSQLGCRSKLKGFCQFRIHDRGLWVCRIRSVWFIFNIQPLLLVEHVVATPGLGFWIWFQNSYVELIWTHAIIFAINVHNTSIFKMCQYINMSLGLCIYIYIWISVYMICMWVAQWMHRIVKLSAKVRTIDKIIEWTPSSGHSGLFMWSRNGFQRVCSSDH